MTRPALAQRSLIPAVLREEPTYRLLFASQVLSVLGDRITSVAMPFAVLAVGGGIAQVAVVSTAQFLPFVVLALPAGVWADTWDRRSMMVAADLVRLTTQTLAAALLLTGTARVAHLVVLAAIFGAADAFFGPAFSGLLPTTVSEDNIQPATALRGLTFSLSNVAGPIVAGGLIAVTGGPGAALAVDAASFAVSVGLLFLLRPDAVEQQVDEPSMPPHQPFVRSLREGWSEVWSRSWVVGFLGGMGTYHVVVLPSIFVVGPVLMEQHYNGAQSWAVVTALFGLGNILGDLVLLTWRPRRALRMAGLMLIGASTQALIIGSGLSVLSIGLLEMLTGICVTATFTLWETSLAEHIPAAALSRVASYDYLATTGAIPLGNLVIGLVAAVAGTGDALAAMSMIGVLAAAAVSVIPSVRSLPRRPPSPGPKHPPAAPDDNQTVTATS